MATDAGNNCILDVERFDLDSQLPLFNGRLSDADIDALMQPRPDFARWAELSARIIGMDHAGPEGCQNSRPHPKTFDLQVRARILAPRRRLRIVGVGAEN